MRRAYHLLAVLLLALPATADDLTISVLDPHSAPIRGARAVLYRGDSDQPLAIQSTTAAGVARFTGLSRGPYRVQVLAPGFAEKNAAVEIPAARELALSMAIAVTPQTVVVTATRAPLPVEETGAPVEVLDSAALTNLQPFAADDALRFLPGAIIATAGQRGGQASLFVRGGESRYNKVLVDGVPVNDPGGPYDFGVLNMTSIDRLEFVRGAESALYGSDAMTSVVQLWSATGSTRTPELRFGADGGSFASGQGFASLAGARGRFDYNLFAQQDATQGQGINDAYSNATQGANLGAVLSPRALLRLRVRHSNSRTGVPGEWSFNGQPLLAPDSDAFARANNLIASAAVTLNMPSRWQHRFTGFEYHHKGVNQDTVVDPGRGCDFATFNLLDCPFTSPFDINRAGLDYDAEWSPRSWAQTALGYYFEDETGSFNSQFLTADFSQFPPVPFVGVSQTHGLRRNHELLGQQTFLWRRFSLIAGARFVHNEGFGNKGVPRVAFTFLAARGGDIFSGTRFRAAYAQGIKEPRFEETFGVIGTFASSPNLGLQPEENRSLEAGIQQAFLGGKYSGSATYYNNLFHNLIEFQSGPNFVGGQYVNIARSLAHGAEVELHGRMAKGLLLSGSYIYTSSQVLSNPLGFDPFLPGESLLRRPRHAASLLLNYSGRRWGGNLGGSFVGRRFDSDFLGLGFNHDPAYVRVDLGAWVAVNRYATAYVNVDNALNQHYEEVVGYPALRANFRAGMRFRVGGE